jgi:hypothetical protein
MTIDQGVCQPKADGYIRSLATRAKQLGVGSPVICLETEASYVVPPTKLPSLVECTIGFTDECNAILTIVDLVVGM